MEDTEKKKRKRMKKLCKDIREQMEFYFSDANLHKDRFLKKKIDNSKEGWIELEMFGNFNKLKQLTDDVKVIAKALSISELLQVSEDGRKVKRKIPISEPKNVDERTVYVECLPSEANHVWVKTTFSHYGKVVYVSLPKYRSTGDIKGFAFVEFETIEDAKRACEEMNNPPARESDQVGIFPVKGNKDVQRMQRIVATQKGSELKKGKRRRTLSETEVGNRKKPSKQLRKRLWSQCSDDEEVPEKKLKDSSKDEIAKEVGSSSSSNGSSESEEEPVKKKRKLSAGEVKSPSKVTKRQLEAGDSTDVVAEKKSKTTDENDKSEETENPEKKKRKKRKKKLKENKKNIPELRVIPKKEWLELKTEYIKLQKENMRELKSTLREIRCKSELPTKVTEGEGGSEVTAEQSGQQEVDGAKNNQLEFVPGVIVHLKSQAALTRKLLKEQLSKHADIKYIEVIDGDNSAHIRCSSAQDAVKVAQARLVENCVFTLLSGEEEIQYWEKILSDREKKLSNKTKTKRRGKDKKISRVDQMKEESQKKKHVFFEEDT